MMRWTMFTSGDLAVSALVMGEITRQLADRLSATTIHTGPRTTAVSAGSVELHSGDRLSADTIVVATDADTAHRLAQAFQPIAWRGVTCFSFDTDKPPIRGQHFVLDGDGAGPVKNLVVMSEVAPQPRRCSKTSD